MSSRGIIASVLAIGMLLSLFGTVSLNVRGDQGSSDGWGYFWTDSDNPPPKVTYSWVEISGTGTNMNLEGDDNYAGPFPVGFNVPFYDNLPLEFYACTNGFLNFGISQSDFWNVPIPDDDPPDAFVAPYWDDLCVGDGYNSGAVFYQLFGSSPSRQLVVEWWQVGELSSPSSPLTFEVILNETGEIWLQYKTLSGMNGWSATAGIENWPGTDGCQYSYNAANLHDSLAVMFSLGPIGFGPDQAQFSEAGETVSYYLMAKNNQGFTDSFDIQYSSVHGWTVGLYNWSMVPLVDTNGNGIPDTGDIPAGEFVEIVVTIDVPASPGPETTTVVATSFADSGISDMAVLVTTIPPALFEPPHSDQGVDTDGDGLYNYLVVDVVVNVTEAGYYDVGGALYDGVGNFITSFSNSSYDDVGLTTVQLWFDGVRINVNGLDGPYFVELYLWGENSTLLDTDMHTTNAYAWDDFDSLSAYFWPPHYDNGYDSNSNGLYDYLVVNTTVEVLEAGWFNFRYDLYDSSNYWMGRAEAYDVYLDVGTRLVPVMFDGTLIGSHGVNGPYSVIMTLWDGNWTFLDDDWHTTQAYQYTQFEGGSGPGFTGFAPPHSDFGEDEDGDGLYDYLVIEARINVSVPGNYYVYGTLFDQYGSWIAGTGDLFYLPLGLDYVQLRFAGFEIRASMANGPYDVAMDMADDEGNWIDSDVHVTSMYYWDDFETPPAELMPPYDDIGIDTDDNGLYDVLEVNVSVEAYEAGFYQLASGLYDISHSYIDSLSVVSFFDVGTNTISLDFYGPGINGNGVDGPYLVELFLYDLNYSTMDTDTYYTSAYTWDEFDPLPAVLVPPYGEYTVDLDSDGLYDYLVVTVPVEVYEAGMYDLWGYAMDQYYNFTADVWNYTYLDVGMHVVELYIPGWAINISGFDGPYEVDFELDDEFGHMLGYDWYITDFYYHSWFDGPPAWFAPPHSDFGVDTDGDSLYDRLAVNAEVYVGTPGVYSVMADLYDEFGMYLFTVTNTTYLDSGLNTIGVSFPGWMLSARGIDCAYVVDLWLEDEDWYILDINTHFTGFYGHDEFDPDVPIIYSSYASAAPMIDGVMSAGEWDGATVVDVGGCDPQNQVEGLMLVMNNATHLFLCYDVVGDMTEDPYDKVTASFDTGNDYVLTNGAEDQFVVGTRYATQQDTWHAVYSTAGEAWVPDCVPFDQSRPRHAGLEGARGFGPSDNSVLDHRVYELTIPLELLGATSGDTLGFAAASSYAPGIYDAVTMEYRSSSWPCATEGPLPLEAYGDLVLAAAPETVASLDGTLGLNDWYVSVVEVTLTASGGQGGINYTMFRVAGGTWNTYAGPFNVWSDGSHIIEYYSVDYGGNIEPTKSIAFDIDQNAPTTTELLMGTGAGEWWSTDVTVQLSVDDGTGSGLDFTMFQVDGSGWEQYTVEFAVTGLGTHTVEFYSVDLAGNEETAVAVQIKIETTAPTTTHTLAGTMGEDNWYTSAVTMALTASDNVGGSGIDQIRYRIDGGAWQTYTSAISISATGSHVVEYYSVDNAGNMETAKTAVFKVDVDDPTSSHALAGTAGQAGWYTSAVSITLAAEDGTGSSGVAEIRYRMGGGLWQTYSAPISISDDGTVVIEYYATDNAGNSETANSVTVKVDKTDPVTTSSVQDGTVTLAASDGASGISGIMYRIDRGSWQDYTAAFTVTAKGNHTIEYYSVDNAGNSEEIKTTWVEIGGGGGILGGAAGLALAIAAIAVVVAVVVWLFLFRKKKTPGEGPAEPPSAS